MIEKNSEPKKIPNKSGIQPLSTIKDLYISFNSISSFSINLRNIKH